MEGPKKTSQAEEKYRTLFESIDEGFALVEVILDENGKPFDLLHLEVNPAYERHTGLTSIVGKRAREIIPQAGPWLDFYGNVALTGEPARNESYLAPPVDRWIAAFATRVGGEGSRRVAIVFNDVTARKRAEAALRESEEKFRQTVELVPVLLWWTDDKGEKIDANHQWKAYTGQRDEEVNAYGWLDAIHPEDLPGTKTAFDHAFATGTPIERQQRIRAADGVYRWFQVRHVPVRDDRGAITRWFGAAIDVQTQHEIEDRLRESEKVRRLALDSGRMGAWTWDTKNDHVQGDAVFMAVYGFPPSDDVLSLSRFTARMEPDAAAACEAVAARELAPGEEFGGDLELASGPTAGRWLRWQGRADRDAPGVIRGVTFDITDRKAIEAERATLLDAEQHARAAAETANTFKDQFLANLGHELRTPLSAMLMWLKMLQGESDPDTLDRGLEAMLSSAQSQQRLIDDLLDSARIATGKLRLELRPVDLGGVIRKAVEAVRPATEAKGIELHADIGNTLGIVMADPDRLQQVVWNLINNAVKFTPAGGSVDLGVWRLDGHVEISVTDTGQGIDAELLPLIFGRFQQADPSRTRRTGGLGLGLSISRQIVELHGGTITVASEGTGRGSVFTIILPLPRTKATAKPPATQQELLGARLVLVEDDAQLREVTAMLLRRAGAAVEAFDAADPAKRAILAGATDVLLCDIGLPEKDGYALIREIREAEPASGRLPAIAFTAFDRPQDRQHAIECGFDEHLAKPVDPAKLVQTIRTLLKR